MGKRMSLCEEVWLLVDRRQTRILALKFGFWSSLSPSGLRWSHSFTQDVLALIPWCSNFALIFWDLALMPNHVFTYVNISQENISYNKGRVSHTGMQTDRIFGFWSFSYREMYKMVLAGTHQHILLSSWSCELMHPAGIWLLPAVLIWKKRLLLPPNLD